MKADFVRRGSRLSLRPWFSRAPRGNGFFFRFFSRGRFLTPNPRMRKDMTLPAISVFVSRLCRVHAGDQRSIVANPFVTLLFYLSEFHFPLYSRIDVATERGAAATWLPHFVFLEGFTGAISRLE
jgi:hypothetical protein